jgi:DNA repair photolyase
MEYRYIRVEKLINQIINIDELFKGAYTIDLYQNCEFGCRYCDSSYEQIVYIKTNAVELFQDEISKLPKGRIIIGSVHDPYQPIEQDFQSTREILKIAHRFDIPIHILTKSTLIKRDLDILKQLQDVYVTITIFTLNDTIATLFEPAVATPKERLQLVSEFQAYGIKTGIAIIPIMPYITDMALEDLLQEFSTYRPNHVLFKHLELKGYQKQLVIDLIKQLNPTLPSLYEQLYKERYVPSNTYIDEINKRMYEVCKNLGLPTQYT